MGKPHACVWDTLILESVSLFFYMFHILYWSFIEEQTSPRKCAEQSNPPQNISQLRLTSFTEEPELSTYIKYVESIRWKNTGLMLTVWYPHVAKAPELMLTSCDIIITQRREYILRTFIPKSLSWVPRGLLDDKKCSLALIKFKFTVYRFHSWFITLRQPYFRVITSDGWHCSTKTLRVDAATVSVAVVIYHGQRWICLIYLLFFKSFV